MIKSLMYENYSPDWEPYNTPFIHKHIETRPLMYTYAYATMLGEAPQNLPDWVKSRIHDIAPTETPWALKLFEESFDDIPDSHREYVRNRVTGFVESMSPTEISELKNFDCETVYRIES